jgi:hypothetical protein
MKLFFVLCLITYQILNLQLFFVLFSIYTGLIYNEFFSVPFELFGPSSYAYCDLSANPSCRFVALRGGGGGGGRMFYDILGISWVLLCCVIGNTPSLY